MIENINFPAISVHEHDIYEHINRKEILLLKILYYVACRRHLEITITLLE